MTFGNYVLETRRRLQDLRTSTNEVITTITTNGLRWTSAEIINICNIALAKAVRLLATYPTSPVMGQIGQSHILRDTTLTITSSVSAAIASTVLNIVSVVDSANNKEYKIISPMEFLRHVASNAEARSNNYFASVFLVGGTDRKLKVTPALSSGTMNVIYIYYTIYSTSDTSTAMFLPDALNDFVLDLAEKEAREREHNWERAKILDNSIMLSLGVGVKGE